ncbi:NTF2-like N-terminal transpeptidase domain-containing protein [Candidatus Chlorohelix sp.]|uniref:NTF2-like N-terminal transpeptidase domain-containing protein n=1 Tax=Candidatus Chlorohelix sp. TaxID=3139201 RepID=UPI003069BC67
MKSRQNIWLLPLLLLFLTGCSDNLTPSEVCQRYLETVREGNYSSAYELLTGDSQLKISRSDFGDRLARAKQDSGIIRTEILKVNRDSTIVGKRASVTYQLEITLQSGQKLNLFEAMVLLQQDNGWRVIWPPQ